MRNPLQTPKQRELTDKQKTFLDALFGAAKGDVRVAADIAGYSSPEVYGYTVAKQLKEEIIELAKEVLAVHSAKASHALTDALAEGATAPGVTARLTAAQQILDRAGIVKHDKLDINADTPIGIFILPAKKEVQNAPSEDQ